MTAQEALDIARRHAKKIGVKNSDNVDNIVANERIKSSELRNKYAKFSPNEREMMVKKLTEDNAYRILKEMQDSIPGAHFLEKHDAQTTLEAQLERVQHAVNPTTGAVEIARNGTIRRPSAATSFLSHRDQLNTIERAKQILRNTNNKDLAEKFIKYKHIIGEGYERSNLNYGVTYAGRTIFKDNKVITAFPKWGG